MTDAALNEVMTVALKLEENVLVQILDATWPFKPFQKFPAHEDILIIYKILVSSEDPMYY